MVSTTTTSRRKSRPSVLYCIQDARRHFGARLTPGSFFPLFSKYIYHLVNDATAVRETTLAVLRDFAADGVVYLELRTTPRAMPGLSKAQYVEIVLAAI